MDGRRAARATEEGLWGEEKRAVQFRGQNSGRARSERDPGSENSLHREQEDPLEGFAGVGMLAVRARMAGCCF